MSFPRYPAYKDSGVEWLGEVPEHWEIMPLKFASSHNDDVLDETTPPETEIAYVDISNVDGVNGITSKDDILFSAAPSRARRLVREGDVIISTVRTYLKAIARIRHPESNLVVSTGFAVIRPRGDLAPDYLGNLVSAGYFVEQVIARSTGVSYPAINASELVAIPVPLPPLHEQTRIAAFLDRETAKIDELVAEQQRLIALLKEKRQAVISHAVTKGLNPAAPMKPSGIEWLGDVPAHWGTHIKLKELALRQTASFTNGPFGSDLLTTELKDEGVPVVYIRDLKISGYCRTSSSYVSPEKALSLDKFRVDPGDVLFAKVGDPPGFSCTYPDSEPHGIVCQDVIRMKPNRNLVLPEYLCLLINSNPGMESIDSICIESTRKRFSLEDLHNLRLPTPPIDEQSALVHFLAGHNRKFDSLCAESQRAIDLLHERRTALISAAVTGQIDVRHLAEAGAA